MANLERNSVLLAFFFQKRFKEDIINLEKLTAAFTEYTLNRLCLRTVATCATHREYHFL
jgi:hypothetical protein